MDTLPPNQDRLVEYNMSIRRTEILLRLKDVVTEISQHFKENTVETQRGNSNADVVHANKYKRAKAIRDFKKRFKRELDFKTNDIITILSQEDSYCWVGRLNGKTGWFPAKFVQILDERAKFYNACGDDSVSQQISHLIRNNLFYTFLKILKHGLRQSLMSKAHPWQFIQEASFRKVEDNFDSVYSRLVICNTFNLEETERILTAEELLFRSVHAVNTSQKKTTNLDGNILCLLCYGLNEQILHIWVKIWCSSNEILKKWYHPWALMRSTDWRKMIGCLNVLSQLPFHLNTNMDWSGDYEGAIKNGLKDLLGDHYLFSWET
ncbi:hypothetical protein Trydic_g6863 [Trypoxylus dichotomus]